MALSLIQQVFERSLGSPPQVGDVVDVNVDLCLTHEVLGPPTFEIMERLTDRIWDPTRVFVTIDHFVPPATREQAQNNRALVAAANTYGIEHRSLYDGPSHQVLAESGLVHPGHVVVGTDSHTCTAGAFGALATGIGCTEMAAVMASGRIWFKVPRSITVELCGALRAPVMAKDLMLFLLGSLGADGANYASLEFVGPGLTGLPMDERLVLTNMGVELGAKTAMLPDDDVVRDYLGLPSTAPVLVPPTDADVTVDLAELEPMCARPHRPDNVSPIAALGETVRIDQAFIGSCTGGRVNDYLAAAEILASHRVAPGVRLVITPASNRIYRELMRLGVIDLFCEAGAIVEHASCGPCAGLLGGIPGDGEVVISASNRNFRGRMGNPSSSIYLASPASVAAAAVAGEVIDPRLVGSGSRAAADAVVGVSA